MEKINKIMFCSIILFSFSLLAGCSSPFVPAKNISIDPGKVNYLIHDPETRIKNIMDRWSGYLAVFNPNWSTKTRLLPGWRDFSRKMESYYSPNQIKIYMTLIHPGLNEEINKALSVDNSFDKVNLDNLTDSYSGRFFRVDFAMESLIGGMDVSPSLWEILLQDKNENIFEPDSIIIRIEKKSRIELFLQAGRDNRAISLYHNLYRSEYTVLYRKSDIERFYSSIDDFREFNFVFKYNDKKMGSYNWNLSIN